MAADVNQMAERHAGRDDRPRWVRFAEQQVLSGWRLVVREAEGRAWWTREGATQIVPIDRARAIAAMGFVPAPQLINADVVEPVTTPAPRAKASKKKYAPRIDASPGGADAAAADEAAALYTGPRQLTIREIGSLFHTSDERVRALLLARGVELRPSGPRRMEEVARRPPVREASPHDVQREEQLALRRAVMAKAIPLYQTPLPLTHVAELMGVHEGTLRSWFLDAGVELHTTRVTVATRLPMPRATLRARVAALYQHPVEPSLKQVAERVGVAVHTVQKCLEEAGVPRRNQGHRPQGPLPADA